MNSLKHTKQSTAHTHPAAKAEKFINAYEQPGVLLPCTEDGPPAYVLKVHDGTYYSGAGGDDRLPHALSLMGMDPCDATHNTPAQVEGHERHSLRGPNGLVAVHAKDRGAFGGPILDVRAGGPVNVTLDASGGRPGEAYVLHFHGTHPRAMAGTSTNDADMLPLMGVTLHGKKNRAQHTGGAQNATAAFVVPGPARTRAAHSHTHGILANGGVVAQQVRRGLIMPMIVRDDLSDQLEKRGLPHALGVNDLVMIMQDERVTRTGTLGIKPKDDIDHDGFLGNTILVNGVERPVLEIKESRIRMRLQNFSTARQLKFAFDPEVPFYVVAGQQGFLTKPRKLTELLLAPAEGAEIVVDLTPELAKKQGGKFSLVSREFDPDAGMYAEDNKRFDNQDRQDEEHKTLAKEDRPAQGDGFEIMRFKVPLDVQRPKLRLENLFGVEKDGVLQGGLMSTLRPLEPISPQVLQQATHRSFQLEGPPLSDNAQAVFDKLMETPGAQRDGQVDLSAAGIAALAAAFAADAQAQVKPTAVQIEVAMEELMNAGNLVPLEQAGQCILKDLARCINGDSFDMTKMNFHIPVGSKEVWEILNPSDMPHPLHVHGNRFRILEVTGMDGNPVPMSPLYVGEDADTVNLPPGTRAKIFLDFTDYKDGDMLMIHCHNLEHEDGTGEGSGGADRDGGMMLMALLDGPGTPAPGGAAGGGHSMDGMDMGGMAGMDMGGMHHR